MSVATPDVNNKPYYCLFCQKVVPMSVIRAGGHGGHLFMEFDSNQHESQNDTSLMRRFREKVENAGRYVGLWATRVG